MAPMTNKPTDKVVVAQLSVNFWKLVLALSVQFAGVVWIARGVVATTEVNSKRVEDIAKTHEVRSEKFWRMNTKVEEVDKRLDRIENKLDAVIDRLQK